MSEAIANRRDENVSPPVRAGARLLGQGVLYALFATAIGYFSAAPAYVHLPPDQALLKLSFSHAGRPRGECRQRTPEELERLPPNMRLPFDCPRERSPVTVVLELDGRLLYRAERPPSGLKRDGTSTVYEKFALPAGSYRLRAQLKDDARLEGFNHEREEQIVLAPGRVFVVDFDARRGGFVFK